MTLVRARSRRRSEAGQGLVEAALVLILLLSAFMGVYATAVFASDQNSATTAVRSGARLGTELGNGGYTGGINPGPTRIIDLDIVNAVCQQAKLMPFVLSIDEVDVYLPLASPVGNADGSYSPNDPVNKYDCKSPNNALAGTPAGVYDLSSRTQRHPNEALLGVQLKYHYHAPTPLVSVTAATSRYAVMAMEPQF